MWTPSTEPALGQSWKGIETVLCPRLKASPSCCLRLSNSSGSQSIRFSPRLWFWPFLTVSTQLVPAGHSGHASACQYTGPRAVFCLLVSFKAMSTLQAGIRDSCEPLGRKKGRAGPGKTIRGDPALWVHTTIWSSW